MIPELHKNEDALRAWIKEAGDLRTALDEHAIVVITDPAGRILFVNDKFCAISKYSRDELLWQDPRILSSGQHPNEFFRTLWKTISSGNVWHGEIRNRAKDGSFYWVTMTIVPFLDEKEKPRQYVAVCSDITEQKRAEAELTAKLRLQRLLADHSERFVALPSEQVDTAIEETQRLIVETLGLDCSTLWQFPEGESSLVPTHHWRRPEWPVRPAHFARRNNLPWTYGKILRAESICFSSVNELPPAAASDAELFRIHGPRSNITIPLIANRNVFGALTFSTLGNERKWQEDEIIEIKLVAQLISNVVACRRAEVREEQLRRELAHAMRVATLGELAAALSHELNQPLAAILSNAQAARRFLSGGTASMDEIGAILDDIVRDDKRAGSVIHNLRGMVSNQPAVREPCCLNGLVREVMELMRGELTAENVKTRLGLADAPPRIEGARVELQQVLVNLVLNAVHAMKTIPPANRLVEIETRDAGDVVVTVVRDHGPGIPAGKLPNVFNPFFTTKANGLGMGLSICRRIVENHAGHIQARNNDDGGASFTFTLPVTRE